METRAEDFTPRILITDTIAETPQHELYTSTLTVSSKHIKLPTPEEYNKGNVGLEAVKIYSKWLTSNTLHK